MELETELRDKNAKIREAEARATAQEAHSKLVVAESQVGGGKEAGAAVHELQQTGKAGPYAGECSADGVLGIKRSCVDEWQ